MNEKTFENIIHKMKLEFFENTGHNENSPEWKEFVDAVCQPGRDLIKKMQEPSWWTKCIKEDK